MHINPNPKLLELLNEEHTEQSRKAKEFLLALTICNTVVVAAHPHHDIVSLQIILLINSLNNKTFITSLNEFYVNAQALTLFKNFSVLLCA